jgi:hypothetical protein
MGDQTFDKAYARVRFRYSEAAWRRLSPRDLTSEIYREMRAIDAESEMQAKPQSTARGGAQQGTIGHQAVTASSAHDFDT